MNVNYYNNFSIARFAIGFWLTTVAIFAPFYSFAGCLLSFSQDNVGVQSIGSVYELIRCSAVPGDQVIVHVLGYKSANDGGGGIFYYDSNSTRTENGGTVLKSSIGASGKGRWIRFINEPRSVLWFGATGNGIDDDTGAIQRAIDDTPEGGKLIFPPGRYLVSGVTVSKPIFLEGYSVSKWFGRGSELIAKGDQRYVLGFISIAKSINGVRLGGEISHIALNGNGKHFSDAIFVGIGFSEVTLKSLEIGNGFGDGVLLRQWYEGKFDDVFINRVDASESNAVFYIGSIMQGKRPANVNNLRVYNSRFEANLGVYFKSANDSNLDIFTLTNSKFECCYEKRNQDVFPIFDFNDSYRVQIFGNSFTHFSFKRGYSPIFRGSQRAGDSKSVIAKIYSNDFIFVDEKTVFTDLGSLAQLAWWGNSISASGIPISPFKGSQPLVDSDVFVNLPRP